jgi:hypothetical protein
MGLDRFFASIKPITPSAIMIGTPIPTPTPAPTFTPLSDELSESAADVVLVSVDVVESVDIAVAEEDVVLDVTLVDQLIMVGETPIVVMVIGVSGECKISLWNAGFMR